ncbi:MAG TPA: hypothetical protein VII92_13330, partial [Anaerolineae bacterium]
SGSTIAHGFGRAPDQVVVQPVSAGAPSGPVAVSFDATNITVFFAGGGSYQFCWQARSNLVG